MANLDIKKIAELTKRVPPPVATITYDIPLRKPDPTEWFTVRDGEEWTAEIPIHSPATIGRQKADQTFIVIDEEALAILRAKNAVKICNIYVLMSRDDPSPYLSAIPLFLPTYVGQTENTYNSTRRACYEQGKKGWVQLANTGGRYDATIPLVKFADPIWPDQRPNPRLPDLKSYLDIAFDKHVIDSATHPVILRMEGKL